MAKIPCEIIRDLLPLYQDDICSEKSRNAIEEHIKECESCRTYLKKMEGEIPIETDKIEGTDEEWKGFREFSEKVSRKLNGRIVMACGVVFLICMMLTVVLYSDAFQSYHLSNKNRGRGYKGRRSVPVKGWQTICVKTFSLTEHQKQPIIT